MNWDTRFINLAKEISLWSKDPSTKVGAIITEDNKIISTGYNGTPRSMPDNAEYYQYPLKAHYIIHAEINAILNSTKIINSNMKMYITHFPCDKCAIIISQSGIKELIISNHDLDYQTRWAEKINISKDIFKLCQVDYKEIN